MESIKGIHSVPDNGFFCPFSSVNRRTTSRSRTIGFCITNDLFSKEYNKGITTSDFNIYMAEIIDFLCRDGNNVVLLPHIPSDIEVISTILKTVSNESKRNHISIGSLDCNGINTIERTFSNYRLCDVIVGMRFHSLVTGIDCRIPTIALAGHEQIAGLFSELGLKEYMIQIDNLCFYEQLKNLIISCLNNTDEIKRSYDLLFLNLYSLKDMYSNIIHSFIE